MIKFSCKNCGQKLNVDDKHSGRQVKCPKCGVAIVVPAVSDKITFHCKSCGQKISVPQIHAGNKGKCPKCQNIVIVPGREAIPAVSSRPGNSIPPQTQKNQYPQEAEETEESEGVNVRLIIMISGAAIVLVFGLILLAVVLRSSGKKSEVPLNQDLIVDRDSQPQSVTAGSTAQDFASSEEKLYTQTKIAFYAEKDGNNEIYVMNVDGSNMKKIISSSSVNIFGLSWSSDGKKIVFSSRRDGNDEIYVTNADGSEQKNLTNNPAPDLYPSWSPDGQKIVFSSGRDRNMEIYVMNADGSEQKRLSNSPAIDTSPFWSPDGKKIAFRSERNDGKSDIYVMNTDGSEQKNLTNSPSNVDGYCWSPDGEKIAFASNGDGDYEIYVINADGSEQKRLTNNSVQDSRPSWSPDGKKIAFQSSGIITNSEIYVMNADGSEQKRLSNSSIDKGGPCWSPDGQKIVFYSYSINNYDICVMNADGSALKNLTNSPALETHPSWSPFLVEESKDVLSQKVVADRTSQPKPVTSNIPGKETNVAQGKPETANTKQQPKYIDYVAELNKLGMAGRSENDNAAPLYQKAIELFPEGYSEIDSKLRGGSNTSITLIWPVELLRTQQQLLSQWIQSNSQALAQLELGVKKPYCWFVLTSKGTHDGMLYEVLLPGLSEFRQLCQTLILRAKLSAAQGDYDKAVTDIVTCYRFGLHLNTESLIEQLVGIAVRSLAMQAAFDILDRTKPNKDLLKSLQSQLEVLSTDRSYTPEFNYEKFSFLDLIQRIFTDDGKGDGRFVDSPEAEKIMTTSAALSQSGSPALRDTARLQTLSRRQTTELLEKHYQYIDTLFRKSPWQLKNENADWRKIAKENPLVEAFDPSSEKTMQVFARCRAETEGLITTLAVLRYKAEKGQLPSKLDELVTAGYLKSIPIDPFSGKSFIYKLTDKENFSLYSFGLNLTDDGGKTGLSPTTKRPTRWADDGDTIFWPVLR